MGIMDDMDRNMDNRFDEMRARADESQQARIDEAQRLYHQRSNGAEKFFNGASEAVGNIFKGSQPEPPKPSSSGGGAALGGLLLAGAAVAGGVYLLSKVFGSDNKKEADMHNKRGLDYFDKNQYEQAIQEYNKAIQINPNATDAHNNRGIAYSKGLRQNEQEIQDFNKAIELNPNDNMAYTNRGVAYAKLGNLNQAISDATKAIELNPNYSKSYKLLGICYRELGDIKRSQLYFAKERELS